MSLADDFVKRLAAVECERDHRPEQVVGHRAKACGPGGVEVEFPTDEEIMAREQARRPFCIARAVMKDGAFPKTDNTVPPCEGCGSTAYGTHFGDCPEA